MVVFSIDGSFTASVSVTGKDPKVTMAKTIMTTIMTIMTGPPELGGRGAALARPRLPHHLRHRQTVYAAAEGSHQLSALSTVPSQEVTKRKSRARLGDT